MSIMQTEYQLTLPKGYVDSEGNLHKECTMRLATAGDEIQPMRDPRVQQNPGYLTVILLSRVITRLGSLEIINTNVIENLFIDDFEFLRNMYDQINHKGTISVDTECPNCGHKFESKFTFSGE